MNKFQRNLEKTYKEFLTDTDPNKFKITKYEKNEYIILSGEKIDYFGFVVSGKIKILQEYENGKTLLIRIFDDFSILGDIEYIQKRAALCTVQAVNEVSVLKVPYSYIDSNYKDNLTFLNNVLLQMTVEILLTNEQALMNNVYSLETRLSSYILSLFNGKNRLVEIPSLTDISNHLGTSYRHLTRTIKKLSDKGVIMKKNKKIQILNMEMLLELSKGNIYESQSKIKIER